MLLRGAAGASPFSPSISSPINDLSIRSKLVMVVAGVVTVLTVLMLASSGGAALLRQVLVSQAVVDEFGPEARLKPLTPVMLKGFSEPVLVFDASYGEAAGT
jgi:class 3 adenylate cyclase